MSPCNYVTRVSPMRNQRGSDPRAVVTNWSRGIMGSMGREAGVREDRSGSSRVLSVVAGGRIVDVVVNVVVVVAVVGVMKNPRGPSEALRRVTSRN